MMGHSKDYGKRSAGFGWLNPYFSRTPDGDTDMENYWIMSESKINELIKELEIDWYVDTE